ncbi:alpha/beta hydrolase fold domain-containing protein [Sarocladium implicatum]|nr:alpha/beta hydrolase fold domain-containing protein [Sarocladium implicatum]
MSSTKIATVEADGVNIFYRYAGREDAPAIVLLHGFPTSSHMFRNLFPRLAHKYRVIAPDLPGFGFTEVPTSRNYNYTFENLCTTFTAFVDALKLNKFAIYIFDYGAPTGLRFALKRPESVAAIVTQNGNAYVEGFGEEFWAPLQKYWASASKEDREALRAATTMDATKWQYTHNTPNPDTIPPESYHLDQALLERPGNRDIQLDLFYSYGSNVTLYPDFQEYFRKSGVPILAVWGKQDSIFVAPGAEAYERDAKTFELHWLEAGHFALERNEEEMAVRMDEFFTKNNVF